MTEFLMTTWHGAGTTPPLMSVARALVARGHHVRVLADPILRTEVEAVGAEHLSWSQAPHRTRHGRDDDFIRDWEPADPVEQFRRMRDRLAVGPAALFAADVRRELEASRPAAVLTEMFLFGSLVAAEAHDVPAVVLNPTINVVPAEGVPPFGQGLLPARDEVERERDRVGAAMTVELWDEVLPALNAARAEHGLPPLDHVLDQGRSAARVLVLTSGAFDFRGPLPPVVKYVGPRLDDPVWATAWDAPPGDQPLVLVALSSDFQDQEDLFHRIIHGLASLPVRGVVTTGQGVDPARFEAPANVRVVRAAPHAQVLREAALAVTHAGHGITIKALAAGVPLVCLPMGRDQFDVAARVTHAGAGVRLEPSASAEAIAAAVRDVLAEPRYRSAAAALAETIAHETAVDLAVAEIEELVSAGADPRPPVPI
jgi:MGT family glycosyltransferase